MDVEFNQVVRSAIQESMSLLCGWPNADGGWGSFPDSESNAWITPEMVQLLSLVDRTKYAPQIERGIEWVVKNTNDEGAWGKDRQVSDTTAVAWNLLALSTQHGTRHDKALKRGCAWLIRTQNDDGGWSLYPGGKSSIYCAAFSLLAFWHLPDHLVDSEVVQAAILDGKRFLLDSRTQDGGWGNTPSETSDPRHTGYAVLTLGLLGLHNEASSGIRWLMRRRNRDGGWGDKSSPIGSYVEDTSSALIALLEARDGLSSFGGIIRKAVRFLLEEREPNGAWKENYRQRPTAWCTHHATMALHKYLTAVRDARTDKRGRIARTLAGLRGLLVTGRKLGLFLFMLIAITGLYLIVHFLNPLPRVNEHKQAIEFFCYIAMVILAILQILIMLFRRQPRS